MHVQHRRRLRASRSEADILVVVVPEHEARYLVGHLLQEPVTFFTRQLAVADCPIKQDLDIDLVVRGIHAGRVVNEIGIDQASGQRVLDARGLGQAQVPALSDHPCPKPRRIDPNRVVGPVADVGVAF